VAPFQGGICGPLSGIFGPLFRDMWPPFRDLWPPSGICGLPFQPPFRDLWPPSGISGPLVVLRKSWPTGMEVLTNSSYLS
jgi:hypothetical protein